MCPGPASSLAPAFLCSPTGHCRNLDRCIQGADPRRIPDISPHFLGPTLRTWACYLTMGAMFQVRIAPEGSFGDQSICTCVARVEVVWGVGTNRYGGGAWITWFSLPLRRKGNGGSPQWKLGQDFGGLRHWLRNKWLFHATSYK